MIALRKCRPSRRTWAKAASWRRSPRQCSAARASSAAGDCALGAVLGAILIETVRNGLNVIDADPYVYPMISGGIIFIAVLLDTLRQERLAQLRRRLIRRARAAVGT